MSANNYMLIKGFDDGSYLVEERDADTDSLIEQIGEYKHSLDALLAAQEHQDENEVEYGIHFKPHD